MFGRKPAYFSLCCFHLQQSKELGMCENEFNYRMDKRDHHLNAFAKEIQKSMK
jgi:hypothetical protein